VHNLWLIFLIFLCTSCYKFRDRFLAIIYNGYHLCFLFGGMVFEGLSTEISPLNNNNNSILLL
jgi:hypothetical protein